jgi:predicted ATPase/DNA-binding CsgD family transcriptional regulator
MIWVTARISSDVAVSSREAEVLAAVAEHLTNAEIAARLFISVRTVESHVSSLLRKLQAGDRRELISQAGEFLSPPLNRSDRRAVASMPTPLTSFVGRESEAADLASALVDHRLVTAIGPGGVGKTRLALRVARDVEGSYRDGVMFVDLVAVTDPTLIATTLAVSLGLHESQSSTILETITSWLGPRHLLLVMDNCEHVLDTVGVLLEQLLAACPRLTILATSRARLMLPFEWAFPVPGLSLEAAGTGSGDAVELFLSRAAGGGAAFDADDLDRIAALCRGLDGVALAIELAAARLPSVGLDGLEAGLADRLVLLTGGSRVDDRHRSLRSALDWSYALLDAPEQAVLRRVSVFAAPFTAQNAADVLAGWEPVGSGSVPAALARLADESFLVTVSDAGGTRYRALETIRQYGDGLVESAGEEVEVRARHLNWCLAAMERLVPPVMNGPEGEAWRCDFDEISREARQCLTWARYRDEQRDPAYRLSLLLADLSFARGVPWQSQRRYELAAELARDDATAAPALRKAAGAATARLFGNEALRLRRAAADAALRAGDRAGAGMELARAAELIGRGPGIIFTMPAAGEVERLLQEARPLAAGDIAAEARILIAEAHNADEGEAIAQTLVDRALELSRAVDDPLAESAALDELTSIQLAHGDVRAALESSVRRTELLAPLPVTVESAMEFFDAFSMASECAVAAGDLEAARRLGEGLCELPFYREEDHLATSRLIVVDLLSGAWDEAVELSARFLAAWERAGRPAAGNLSRASYAAATVHALRGDDVAREAWMGVVATLNTSGRPVRGVHFGEFFDALVLLHRGQARDAVNLLAAPPEAFRNHYNGVWRAWYASAWAEAAVLAGHPDADDRVDRARGLTLGNPVAYAIVMRASALAAGAANGRGDLVTAAAALLPLGSRYQWARTLVMLGGADRERGEQELAAIGATPMAWPPG